MDKLRNIHHEICHQVKYSEIENGRIPAPTPLKQTMFVRFVDLARYIFSNVLRKHGRAWDGWAAAAITHTAKLDLATCLTPGGKNLI